MKKSLVLLSIGLSFLMSSCIVLKKIKMKQTWATGKEFKTPESVLFDKNEKILYVSNINGKPLEKNGNGFISQLTLEGKVVELHWSTGFNAPKGMGISHEKLYVADIDRVVSLNRSSGIIADIFHVKDAVFLNDITVGDDGSVFISDMSTNTIYIIKDGSLSLFLNSEKLKRVNGLFFEDGYLLAGTENSIVKIDIKKKEITTLIDNTGKIDGLEALDDGIYVISDWSGKIQLVNSREKVVISDTTKQKINAADIEVIPSMKMLFVPTFFNNRVVAYTFDF
jgi:sugar lactone lactonase YvrE